MAMQYRRFGRTQLQMPIFSCGGMRYQYSWKDRPMWRVRRRSQRNLEAIVHRSLEVGINHFETARAYGTSDLQLGRILKRLPREQIIVQTKVMLECTPKEFRREFDKSLANLKLDYVDLLGLHGINTHWLLHDTIRPGGFLDVVRQLQEQGKVRFVGFSTHGPTDVIVKAIETNQFDYVNLHWYYINQSNWPAIEAASRHDMGVFIISPTDKGGMLQKPSQKLVDLCAPLSPMVFNDLFCLSHPQVNTLSIGAFNPTDFNEHLKAVEWLDRADELLSPILVRLEQEAIAVLGEEWVKTWQIGLPNHEETPGLVNIPAILWLRNLALAYDMVEYAKGRYNLLDGASHWFPGSRADRVRELDLRYCLRHSPHADKIPALLEDAHQLLGGEKIKRLSQQ